MNLRLYRDDVLIGDEIPEMKHIVVQLSEHIQRGLEKRVVLKLG
jgi:hypothetical protein